MNHVLGMYGVKQLEYAEVLPPRNILYHMGARYVAWQNIFSYMRTFVGARTRRRGIRCLAKYFLSHENLSLRTLVGAEEQIVSRLTG